MDGIDNSEILLIDSLGCPTDASIMGSLSKASNSGKTLLAPFEAFKFPTSDIVQFKALVTPCLPNCEPVDCSVKTHGQTRDFSSMGRRKRRGTAPYDVNPYGSSRVADKDDVVVVQTIQITDKFGFEKQDKLAHKRGMDDINEEEEKQAGRRLHHPQHPLLRVTVLHERKTLIAPPPPPGFTSRTRPPALIMA
ncbi:ZP domain-containing protein [Caerostris darwini]|uniref:ZP domain-containing protein n=1 Tax=Caerostris darwini TaxID=1538125 RepID=A0AAV4NX10_9ARAC|nr:ZP domain-containing protein [Caerostris darwini]